MSKTEKLKEKTTQDIARETMTGDLRDCLLDFMKHEKNPLPWNMQTEEQQRHAIEKVTKAVQYAVEKAVSIIAADGRAVIKANVEQITVKDGIKAVLKLSKSDELRHDLVDSQGEDVLLVVSSMDVYEGERKAALPDPDQPPLMDDKYPEAA